MSLPRVIALACVNAALLAAADSDIDVASPRRADALAAVHHQRSGRSAGWQSRQDTVCDAPRQARLGWSAPSAINVPKAKFLTHVRDIARFKSGPDVLQIGRFSRPPTLDDLAALTVDRLPTSTRERAGSAIAAYGCRRP